MTGRELTAFLMPGIIAFVMTIVALLDWLGERQRQRRHRAHRR